MRAHGRRRDVRRSTSSRRRAAAVLIATLALLLATWGGRLVELHHSVGANAAYWAEPRGEAGGLLYVAMGDSAAQSIGASDPSRGYVALLSQRLHDSSGLPVQVVNLSASGARIADVLDGQLAALRDLPRPPDVVTVAIGGNDVRHYDSARFALEAERLARALPAGSFVADAPYFMHGHWERDAVQAANALTRAVRTHGLHPVPLHEALRAQGRRAMRTQFAADWFHPNDRGHRVWAEAFWTVMEPWVQRAKDRGRRAPLDYAVD